MDANAKRPWHRLHWGTVLTVFFVGLAWAGHAFPITIGLALHRAWPSYYYSLDVWGTAEGWPLICINTGSDGSTTDLVPLLLDCGFMVACLASTVFVVERLERGGLRFRASTMLLIVAALGVILGLIRWDAQLLKDDDWYPSATGAYAPIAYRSWHIAVPILFAFSCLVCTVLHLALMATTRFLAFLRLPAHAKAESDGSSTE
jgi:hypothetical protein